MLLKEYNRGDVIFREGDFGRCMYRIIEGSVSVQTRSGNDDVIELTTLGMNRIFGEMAVLEAWPRSATIIAKTDETKVLEIDREEISEFFTQDPRQVRNLMANLSHRLRELTNDYLEACATIREMDATKKQKEKRSGSLLDKIVRYMTMYGRTVRFLTGDDGSNDYLRTADDSVDKCDVYRKNTVIFNQGDAGDSMYYLKLGSVGIYTGYGTDSEKMLVRLVEDDFFGEMGLIEKLPRSAAAVILEDDTVLRKITEEELEDLFRSSPGLVLRCLRHLSRRLRSLTGDYVEACEMIAKLDAAEKGGKKLTKEEKNKAMDLIDAADTPKMC